MNNCVTFSEIGIVPVTSDIPVAYDDMQGVISDETRQLIENICYAGVTTITCLVGIPGNIINCVVFHRQGLRERMHLCLFSLSLVDCCYLLCALAMYSVGSFVRFFNELTGDKYLLKTINALVGIAYGLRSTSSFIYVVITVDRCLCVIFPLKTSSLIKTRTVAVLIAACFILFQSCFIVFPFTYIATLIKTETGLRWIFLPTQFFRDTVIFMDIFSNFLFSAIPIANFVIIAMATVLTVIKLQEAMSWRLKTSSSRGQTHGQQVALTKMLVTVSSVYIINTTPLMIKEPIICFLKDCLDTGQCFNLAMVLIAICESCLDVNSSIHIFLYYFRSSRYRAVFLKMFCGVKNTGKKNSKQCLNSVTAASYTASSSHLVSE